MADEAAMTGESDEVKKEPFAKCLAIQREKEMDANKTTTVKISRAHDLPSPIMMSGSSISGGEGKMVSIMVGDSSSIGLILKITRRAAPEITPLQHKLEEIATDIGKLGTYVALLTIHILLHRFFIEGFQKRNVDIFGGETIPSVDVPQSNFILDYLKLWIGYVIIGIAIIVVAVPEGLPLAVMISLAYSIERMLKDNNDVKRLASCEIMGGANNICSDKTGTLTLNSMKVTKIWCGKTFNVPQNQDEVTKKMMPLKWNELKIQPIHSKLIEQNVACNTASKAGATDLSMVELLERCGTDSAGL